MKRLIYKPLATLVILFLGLAAVSGCDSVGGGESGGSVQVLLTDAPIDNIAEANVTIERVELLGEAGTIVLLEEEARFDLLELTNGITTELAQEDVPAGVYHQIRLIVQDEAEVVFTNDSTATLKVPSGTETGIKLNLPGGFRIGEGAEEASILLDFDASKSFVRAGASGKYIFKPVVKVETVEVQGEEVEDSPEVTGAITAVGDSLVEVEGIALALTEQTDVDVDEGDSLLVEGTFVEADVTENGDGTYEILEIERSDDGESVVKAPLDDVLATAIVALGTSFDVSADTDFEGVTDLAGLEAGNFVTVTFSYDAAAETYTATAIDFEGEEDVVEEEEGEED